MSLSKLFTAAKGIFNNSVEAAVDGQAVTILEQEIREVKESLRKSDHSRTQILAKKKSFLRKKWPTLMRRSQNTAIMLALTLKATVI